MKCRFCGNRLTQPFVDLASAPPSNSFLAKEQLNDPEIYYPLKLFVCDTCFLVQIDEYRKSKDIFDSQYAYFSSYSTTWLTHAKQYVEMMVERFGIGRESRVIEIASNDGYLLQYFKEKDIPVLGIDPAEGTAAKAKEKGIETLVDFFSKGFAQAMISEGVQADLLIGNNVLAHVPDLNDFVAGLKTILKTQGLITMEFPHLMRLVDDCQFDTIYHEHFSYFSFTTISSVFSHHGLELFDVDELTTHGGSLRIYAKHSDDPTKPVSRNVHELLEKEALSGVTSLDYYSSFQARVDEAKYSLLQFLIEQKRKGRKTVGYGAAAKGNTLLNYCGIKEDLLAFVVDASPYKQGKHLPGSHIPVLTEEAIKSYKPAYVLILPWNIRDEIMEQLGYIRTWGAKFVVPIPVVEIL